MFTNKFIVLFLIFLAPTIVIAANNAYQQHNLVSDGFAAADFTDANMVNPWGLAFLPTGTNWINANGSGKSIVINGLGLEGLTVNMPIDPTMGNSVTPTGIAANNTSGWVITNGSKSGVALFLFSTENGQILGWSPMVEPNMAIIAVNNSTAGAVYKGLTIAADGKQSYLYATNFYSGAVEVYDADFMPVVKPNAFMDPQIPKDFAPFGIQNINGNIYVTYAQQDADKHDNISGPGLGYVDVFDTNGKLLQRVAANGPLNAPWGLALAPANFGEFSNALLIGNFGDGKINAIDLVSKQFMGNLAGVNGGPLILDGLWAISFGNGFKDQPPNFLFFTAGLADETHGLYGFIAPLEESASL